MEALDEDPIALPCGACPRETLQRFMASGRGVVIQAAVDLDWAIRCGLQVTLRDVTYMEYLLLRQISEERANYEKEMMKREQEKAQRETQRRGR